MAKSKALPNQILIRRNVLDGESYLEVAEKPEDFSLCIGEKDVVGVYELQYKTKVKFIAEMED